MFSGILFDPLPVQPVAIRDGIEYRIVNPVEMPLCVFAMLGVTEGFFAETDLLLCGQGQPFTRKALSAHGIEGFLGHLAGDGFGR
ncbi:hypothetical protein SDC9_121245 [bioreactor metagenome]|uniref:Uncharacterized protein n=1 Tax=bioreactor metagenome TaxID=1076179 RepID=A0A645CBG1_9ZZZZ